ncbi:MAG: SAM-dependent DNA methyltransferase, partial [Gemmatimonadota bacterium]
DPACGDGRFLVAHPNSVGVEQDPFASTAVHERAPGSLIHQGDFFSWAAETRERFHCATGNPPFIRYQRFTGETRKAALALCVRHGAQLTALSSSWAPFLLATATLLQPGGRMAFVVPAEIGHAPYAGPLLEYMGRHFSFVQIIAVRRKLFPELSEDCWLLYADGFGGKAQHFLFSAIERFSFMDKPPDAGTRVPVTEWRAWNARLRPFLLPPDARGLYQEVARDSVRLGDIARVGIGYVTGANDFFHLRPSEAKQQGISGNLLHPAVRNGKALKGRAITWSTVASWWRRDEPTFLLRLTDGGQLPAAVRRYLDSPEGREARTSYKCRNRTPWYVVPDVTEPNAFLSYMSGDTPRLVANQAKCVATNSVHVVKLTEGQSITRLQRAWDTRFTQLSCELEGHPLGGGLLKLEPGEAVRVVVPEKKDCRLANSRLVQEAINIMRQWRHHGEGSC